MVALSKLARAIGDELIAIQIRNHRRMEFTGGDQRAKFGESRRERVDHLTKRLRLELELGDTSAFARNAEEFDVHAGP